MNDPWTNEDAEENANPEAWGKSAQAGTQAAPSPVAKPNVYSHPSLPTLVLPKPEIKAEKISEPEPEIKDEFPNDYGECLTLSKTFFGADKLPDKPTPEQTARYKKFQRLKAHMLRIQNTATTDANPREHARILAQHVLSGDRNRAAIVESHKFAKAANAFARMTVTPGSDVPEAVKCALKDEAIVAQVNDCRASVSEYYVQFLENWNITQVRQRQKEIQYSYGTSMDFESAKKLADEATRLHSPAAMNLAAAAKRMLQAHYEKECKPKLLKLLQSIISHIGAGQAKARQAEKDFFASQGEKVVSTSVSRKFDLIIARLREREKF